MRNAFLVAALVALACRGKSDVPTPIFPAGTPFRAQEMVIDDTRLRFIDTGRGPAVVFIHGLGASMYTWRHQFQPVLDAGFRIVAFDNRGFGFSDRSARGYTNADYGKLLASLLDSLGTSAAVLVGHSMGAAIAGETALLRPDLVRGMVLVGPAGYGPAAARLMRWPMVGRLGTMFTFRSTSAVTLRSCFADPRRVTEADVDQYYAPVTVPGTSAALRRVLREFSFEALQGRLHYLEIPTLVLWGAADRWIPFAAAAGLAHELPRSAFVVIQDAGHNVQEEQAAEVNRAVLGFLQNGLPSTPTDLAGGLVSLVDTKR